jgi:hypothetical protein
MFTRHAVIALLLGLFPAGAAADSFDESQTRLQSSLTRQLEKQSVALPATWLDEQVAASTTLPRGSPEMPSPIAATPPAPRLPRAVNGNILECTLVGRGSLFTATDRYADAAPPASPAD